MFATIQYILVSLALFVKITTSDGNIPVVKTVVSLVATDLNDYRALLRLPARDYISFRVCFTKHAQLIFAPSLFEHLSQIKAQVLSFDFTAGQDPCGLGDALQLSAAYLHFYDYRNISYFSTHLPPSILDFKPTQSNPSLLYIPRENVIEIRKCLMEGNVASTCGLLLSPPLSPPLFIPRFTPPISASPLTPPPANIHKLDSGPCQLWWPWNQSEVFLHQPVPQHLSPLILRTSIILRCRKMIPSFAESDLVVKIIDCEDSKDCLKSAISMSDLNSDSEDDGDSHSRNSVHHIATRSRFFAIQSHENISIEAIPMIKRTKIIVLNRHSHTTVAHFDVAQRVVFGSSSSPTARNHYLHALAGQLDTRDDLGYSLAALLPQATSLVEVGVQRGVFAELLLHTATSLTCYVGVDAWRVWPEYAYIDEANHADDVKVHTAYRNEALQRLSCDNEKIAKYTDEEPHTLCAKQRFLLQMTSLEAAAIVADASVDIVYLDAMHHYEAVWADILAWWPKVRLGGLLAGHDYLLDVLSGTIFTVQPAVREFARQQGLLLLQTQDATYPSWLLFKPHEH